MWTGSFLRSFGITSKQPPSFHESRLKGWFLDIIQSTTFFQSKSLNHIGPPPKKWPNIFWKSVSEGQHALKNQFVPFIKDIRIRSQGQAIYSQSCLQWGKPKGSCAVSGVSVNFVGFEERMEYPLGNDHISPPSKGTFLSRWFSGFPFGGICDGSLWRVSDMIWPW